MNKIAKLLTATTLGLSLLLTGCASNDAPSTDETPTTGEGRRLEGVELVFIGDAFNPYRIVGDDGSKSGYDFAVQEELQEILGYTIDFEQVEFAAVLSSIAAGTADFGMTLTPTEERKETFGFTQAYYEPKSGVLSAADSGIESWEDLAGKTVIAPSSTLHAEVAYSIPDVTVLELENIALGCEEVLAGRADAVIADSVQLTVYGAEYGMDVFATTADDHGVEMNGYTIAFKKGSEYIDDFNYAFDILKENGTLTELQKEWLGETNAIEY